MLENPSLFDNLPDILLLGINAKFENLMTTTQSHQRLQ